MEVKINVLTEIGQIEKNKYHMPLSYVEAKMKIFSIWNLSTDC